MTGIGKTTEGGNGNATTEDGGRTTVKSTLTDQDIIDFTEQLYTIGKPDFVGSYIVYDDQPPGP